MGIPTKLVMNVEIPYLGPFLLSLTCQRIKINTNKKNGEQIPIPTPRELMIKKVGKEIPYTFLPLSSAFLPFLFALFPSIIR
jgi:hypothetical protein